MKRVSDIGEDKLIQELTQCSTEQANVVIGPGDDCAVITPISAKYQLLKTDTIIENVHFLPDADPYWVGWKAVARVVSDFAAMGGKPDSIVIALALKANTEVDYLKKLYQGIHACAEQFQFSIVGGETSSSTQNVITVSGTGYSNAPVSRSNAQAGDHIYVTGKLGGSISGKHLTFTPRVHEAEWICNQLSPTAMMDLSDGLAKDLPRLADLSRVGYQINFSSIPKTNHVTLDAALSDGEDYELLFCSPIKLTPELLEQWNNKFADLPLSHIGTIQPSERSSLNGGWEHFS